MKILVVDYFATMRKILKSLLGDIGFSNVDEADDGLTALPMLQNGQYEFLITDWNMPGMSGLDLLKNVREDNALSSLPVLMVTAETKRDIMDQAMTRGVNGYVVKPFTACMLKEKIEHIFTADTTQNVKTDH